MTKQQLVSVCALAAMITGAASAQSPLNQSPTRVLGAPSPLVQNVNPNYVDGRELFRPFGIALDTSVSPPILYVADTANNRVLAWRNAASGQSGAKADLVIGQRDFTSTIAQNPATSGAGLASPTGLAVDAAGNLYVADTGNNRVLRFPKPFEQTGVEFIMPDRVIGQPSFNSRAANGGATGPTETGLALVSGNNALQTGLAVDGEGSLFVADPGNHRVLRFHVSALNQNNPPATLVIGQANFNTRTTGTGNAARANKTLLNTPTGVTLDAGGRLYVCDALSRVLAYFPPFMNSIPAGRIAGIAPTGTGAPATPVNNITLGSNGTNILTAPIGVFILNNGLAVVDRAANRIVQYPPAEQWPPEPTQFSPTMSAVIGQPDFSSFRPNGGQTLTTGAGFLVPSVAAAGPGSTEVFVADTSNNRVLRLGGGPLFATPLQVFGQAAFHLNSPNLTEGREFFLFNGFSTITGVSASFAAGTGLAVDAGNHLYIADTVNNRVLGFRDARALRNGNPADLVIGQEDLAQTFPNSPSNDVNIVTDSSLFSPAGVAVDRNGDLYVADTGNGRVLRFPKPFDQPAGARQHANLVLGQAGFTTKFTDATARNMRAPFGLAFTGDGSILATDALHNRVLYFQRPAGGDFTNGQDAALVFGQPDFISTAVTTADPRRLISPRGIAVDSDDRPYVCDTGRNRVVIYNRASTAGIDPNPALTITAGVGTAALRSPHGVYVSLSTGEIWIADTLGGQSGQALRYPPFIQLTQGQGQNYRIPVTNPLGLTQDQYGNLYIADAANRIDIYYPTAAIRNAANSVEVPARAMAPNTYMSIYQTGLPFANEIVQFSTIPMPTTLADIQVTLNDKPLPLHFVSPGQINAYITNDAPTGGNAEVLVMRPSSGQILAASTINMGAVAPALFTRDGSGQGQLAATNQDGSVNSTSNPAPQGSFITLYGTGLGVVTGAPPDGVPPDGPVSGPMPDRVIINGEIPMTDVQYSGLAPTLIGVWQINAKIPDNAPPGEVRVSVQLASLPSNRLPQFTTIAVRQR